MSLKGVVTFPAKISKYRTLHYGGHYMIIIYGNMSTLQLLFLGILDEQHKQVYLTSHTANTISNRSWTDVGLRKWFIDVNTLN